MKVKVEDSVITIEVVDLLDHLDSEERSGLAQSLAIMDDVFEAVCGRLIDGETKDGYRTYPDDRAEYWRAKLLESLPEVTFQLVRKLMHDRAMAQESEKHHRGWAWALSRDWPDEHWRDRPREADFKVVPSPEKEDVERVVGEILGGDA